MRYPGDTLRHFAERIPISQGDLAAHLGVSRCSINQLMNGKRGFSADIAIRLSQAFGTTPEFWLEAQIAKDLWEARRRRTRDEVRRVRPLAR